MLGLTSKKTLVATITIIMMSSVVTGCGKLNFRSNEVVKKPAQLIEVKNNVNPLALVFSTRINAEKNLLRRGESLSKEDVLDLQIGVFENRMVVASRNGVIEGFNAYQKVWSVTMGEPITSGVSLDESGQVAVVTTRSGKVVVLDVATGQKRWETALNATVLAPALIYGNRVLLSANDGVLHGLNLQNGTTVWQFSTQNPNVSVRGAAKPLRLDARTAVFGTADGRIHAVNPETGSALWTRRVGVAIGGSDVGRMSDVDGTPLVVGNRLYVTSYSGHFVGFDMSTGQTLFVNREFASLKPVVLFGDILVGVDTDGIVYGFNPMTGEKLWKNNALLYRKPSNLVVIGEYVAVADFEGVVHLYNLEGNLVGRTSQKAKDQITSLQVHGNRLYAQTTDGAIAVWQVQ